jgi:penicillin-binding protein 2
MANVVATIANRGYYYTPHCIKGVGNEKYIDSKFKTKHYVGVQNQEAYQNVIDGMQGALEPGGTAFSNRLKDIVVCGKTGTAQNPGGKDHSVFLAFAPRDNPKIAIACIVENAGFGNTWAAPVVTLMIEKYLRGKTLRPDVEKRILEADLIHGKNLIPEGH